LWQAENSVSEVRSVTFQTGYGIGSLSGGLVWAEIYHKSYCVFVFALLVSQPMSWWDWDVLQKIWRHTVNSAAAISSWKLLYWFAHFKSGNETVLLFFDKTENVVVVIVLLSLAVNLVIDVSPPILRDWVRAKLKSNDFPSNIVLA
jgi:hypothetical protein